MNATPSQVSPSDNLTGLAKLKHTFVMWLLAGEHLGDVTFGTHSVTIGNLITMDTQAPSAAGQIGMDATSGRIRAYIGGAARDIPGAHEVLKADGTVAATADINANSHKVTNLSNGTAGTDAVNKSQLDAAITGLVWDTPVSIKGYIGTRTIAQIDALSPVAGDAVVAGSAGTPAAAGSDTLAVGDTAEYSGTAWKKILTNVGGFPANNVRMIVGSGPTALFSPLADPADKFKIVTFNGASLTPSIPGTVPLDGAAVLVIGNNSVNENHGYTFDGDGTIGWVQFSGAGLVHSALSGLAGDDHTQYALLAGRAGGQTYRGGANANDNLVLESTSNGTKGSVQVASGSTLKMMGDDTFIPNTTGQGKLGTSSNKFAEVRALNVYSGDLHLQNPRDEKADWTVVEGQRTLSCHQNHTGVDYELVPVRPGSIASRLLKLLG